jgi:hypothetical protein
MKRALMAVGAGLLLLLGGCATTVRSDVTTFNQWPAQMDDKSYMFERPLPQEDTLEWRNYQELVRGQLARLGFHDAGAGKPAVTVSMHFTTIDVPVHVLEPVDPFFYAPSRRLGWTWVGHRRFYRLGGWYNMYYDPFWGPYPYGVEDRVVHQYQRELKVGIKSAVDGKPLFDVTVRNNSRQHSTPVIMPALVQSAFTDFPGRNGAARVVELKQHANDS